uniref:Uncharacterized protein n=1 Tax=Tetradesmus obliquus TaxID=3088 RepID=A0A383WHP1_TETOB|eukprot:jgi/Sobl393_1/8304/SZX76941.1
MGTLARLKAEKERLQNEGARKVFVSSSTVQAFRVAHNNKELLSSEYPLILAVPPGGNNPNALPLLDASVGPSLRWSLSSVNHVLRTASKHGEPTYIFAGILDNDPQAFVAVTLRKSTPEDELSHLEAVVGRASQLHIAEKKPMQVPDAGQVVSALGKGLKQVLGISSGSSSAQKQREREQAREQQQQEQQQREEEQRRRDAADRVAYLAGRAGVGTDADAPRVAVHGRPVPEVEDRYAPSAPYAMQLASGDRHEPSGLRQQQPAMGVTSKAAANDRLAALKAELAREGAPPSAPDVHARPEDSTSSGLYTPSNPTAPAAAAATPGGYYSQQQQQHYEKPWEQHVPGTLSNPYTTEPAHPHYPSIPSATDNTHYGYDNSSSSSSNRPQGSSHAHVKYAQVPGGYKEVSPSGPGGYGGYDSYGSDTKDPWGRDSTTTRAGASELERQLQEEARQARLEWEAEQREAERQRQQQASRTARGGDDDDGGWGREQGRQRQQQQQQKEKQQAPDWLDLLGKVFGGGPAYGVAAPDL